MASELVHSEHEIIKSQHDAGDAVDCGDLVKLRRDRGVGAAQGLQVTRPRVLLGVGEQDRGGLGGGLLVHCALRTHPGEGLEIGAHVVQLQLCVRASSVSSAMIMMSTSAPIVRLAPAVALLRRSMVGAMAVGLLRPPVATKL